MGQGVNPRDPYERIYALDQAGGLECVDRFGDSGRVAECVNQLTDPPKLRALKQEVEDPPFESGPASGSP
jgi:hypothetical protein